MATACRIGGDLSRHALRRPPQRISIIFVSFAPNFEDVMLWRAFSNLQRGFYVDAGATDPDAPSVTRAFSDRGWTGLNLVATPSAFRRIAPQRARDVTLELALGAAAGSGMLAAVDARPELSTLDPSAGDLLFARGFRPVPTPVNVETLAAVLRSHAPDEINFLRIDQAGGETAALAGADFSRMRPWIVLVRAITPLSNTPGQAGWEPALLAAGYRPVWFDGVNRFYVAEEHHARLAPSFDAPPNSRDDFLPAAYADMATRIAGAETRAEVLADQLAGAQTRAREDIRAAMEARVLNEHRIQQVRAIEQHARNVEAALATETIRADTAASWLEAVRQSSSWRVTAPVRRIAGRLARRPPAMDQALPARFKVPPLAKEASDLAAPTERARHEPQVASPRGTVHQFHPGSARGDAVTNSMLLIRRILRDLGFASEIYCDQPDPELAHVLRHSAQLPLHADYVLVVHFSLGFEDIERITRLPAPKLLMYHNITPPALLEGAPTLQQLARLGREQLSVWARHVAAALAVSEFNALDLRQRGFASVQACPLLFDVEAMRRDAGTPVTPRTFDGFTVLFVGRIVGSKAQDDLVEAFALFRQKLDRPARLVLVGRVQTEADGYLARLTSRIAALGLDEHVILAGFVDDHTLRKTYRDADLYVSLSHHEGFGVPLVEAMAHGVPVLAWPCGAVPYTIGAIGADNPVSQILEDRSPQAVSERMLQLARDPALVMAILRQQNRQLDRFRLERHVPHLLNALASAGARLPEDPSTRTGLLASMRFAVAGHINGTYSLAAINRGMARSIEAIRPGRTRIIAVEGQPTDDLSGVPAGEATQVGELVLRPPPATGPEVVISQHYPVFVPHGPHDLALALFFWEESVIPLETVRVLNSAFRGVLAPSGFVAKVLVDSGVSVPVHLVGQSPDLSAYRAVGAGRVPASRATTTFLHISSCMERKGVDVLLAAYVRAFRATDPVRLVIKGFPNPHNTVPAMVDAVRAADPNAPEIVVINRDLEGDDFLDLFRNADVMVLPTRGEGFNLPAAEAMAARLPLIVTGRGGHADFCTPAGARLLRSRHAPSASHLASTGSLWLEPSEDDLVAALRELRDPANTEPVARRVRAAAAAIDAATSDRRLVERIEAAALDCLMAPLPPPPRSAWITTWNVRCGVAEYSRHLLDCWPGADRVVLADARTETPKDAGPTRVRIGWRLGDEANPGNLADIVAQEDPTVVVIQHQPGLLPWPVLARLLEAPELAERVVVVTLHNTSHLAGLAAAERADIAQVLRRVARVIVHTVADIERLETVGVEANVVLMPHGVPQGRPPATPRALPPDGEPIIGCYGFFLPGKGIGQLIDAAAILRRSWPRLRLRLVNAHYGTPDSGAEIAACRSQVERAGLRDAVEFHTEFLPETESRDLLAGCDLVVLPYQSSLEASSAALRSVLAVGIPVAVTPLAVFDDAGEAVERLAGVGPDDIATGIATLLTEIDRRQDLQARATMWMRSHAWPDIAERLHGLLQGAVQEARIRSQRV